MGKASSSKKIRKVQQAGVSRAPGQRRNLGYPALIVAIMLVGSVFVYFAREDNAASASEAPVANRDHWHMAFGIDICGQFEGNVSDVGPDRYGIHTHQDGLIHVHPFGGAASGERATFSVFAEQVGIQLGDGEFTLPDGRTYADGDDCETDDGTQPGRVALYVWPPQATDATEPEVITSDIGSVRFRSDGQAFVLAFTPEDDEPTLPPTVPALANPADLAAEQPEEGTTDYVGDVTTTTAPAGDAPAGDAPPATDPPGTTQPGG
jgi:hypothetical protein